MVDIKFLLHDQQSGVKTIDTTADVSYIQIWGGHPFTQPVKVHGTLEPIDDYYVLKYNTNFIGEFPCGRCLSEVERKFDFEFSHLLKEGTNKLSDESEIDYLPIHNGKIDLSELVGTDLLLALDNSYLCSPDCKGLCPSCGTNLNDNACDCKKNENLDPRFDILRKLLSEDLPE